VDSILPEPGCAALLKPARASLPQQEADRFSRHRSGAAGRGQRRPSQIRRASLRHPRYSRSGAGHAGDRIERIEGILNGTCNFILSKMEAGAEYAPVLAEAQAKGYAEADPTEDVGGFDARAKLAILMRLALRVQVNPEEIVPRPITAVAAVDFSYARDLGCTIRQIARAEQVEGRLAAAVGPMLVALRSPLAWSQGTENMVIASGHYGGDVVFSAMAGGQPTRSPWSAICSPLRTARAASNSLGPAHLDAEFEVRITFAFWFATVPAS